MRNQKIGIGLVHCLTKTTTTGYDKVFTSDNEQWSNLIDDTGDVFKYIKLTQSDVIIRMIKFVREGWYMCSMKPVLGRNEEYRSCWIYFPVSLDIDANSIESIINDVEKEIKTNDYNEQNLKDIVNRYSLKNEHAALYKVPNQQQGFAIRYVDEGCQSLYDIYGNIYQKDFVKYNWVVLMPKSSVEIKTQGNIDDITSAKLIGSHVITLGTKHGFVPYYNEQEFCHPIRITEDENITIVWRKDGYLPIQKSGKKESDFEISRNDYERIFRLDSIKVSDAETDSVLRANFKLNRGRLSDDRKLVYIKEDELSMVTVTVSADNYETQTIPLNLSGQVEVKPIEVRLCPHKYTYVFMIPLGNEYKAIEQYTSKTPLTECPIEGYECKGRIQEGDNYVRFVGKKETNEEKATWHHGGNNEGQGGGTYHKPGDGHLHNPKPKKKKWYRGLFNLNTLVLFVIVIVFVLVVGALCYVGYKWFFADNESPMEYTPVVPEYVKDKSTWEAAKAYLDSCQNIRQAKWVKSEMDQYDELRGLYEHINMYEFKEIISILDKHKDDFMRYDEYSRLYEIAKTNPNKNGQYSNDGTITFDTYLKKDFASMKDANAESIPEDTQNKAEPEKQQEYQNSSKTGQTKSASKESKGSTTTNQGNNQDNNI